MVVNPMRRLTTLAVSILPFVPYCRSDGESQNATAETQSSENANSTSAAGIIGALGSIIGYLGSEVADETIFERLLWPERFHNRVSFTALLKIALSMPMGGPLHKAALKTLDAFGKNHLYRGPRQGHMLGTAFYADSRYSYIDKTNDKGDDARSALLIRALRLVKPKPLLPDPSLSPSPQDNGNRAPKLLDWLRSSQNDHPSVVDRETRTITPVHYLFVNYANGNETDHSIK